MTAVTSATAIKEADLRDLMGRLLTSSSMLSPVLFEPNFEIRNASAALVQGGDSPVDIGKPKHQSASSNVKSRSLDRLGELTEKVDYMIRCPLPGRLDRSLLPPSTRAESLRETILILSADIAATCEGIKDPQLPKSAVGEGFAGDLIKRNLVYDWQQAERRQEPFPFSDTSSPEASVRCAIENAWLNLSSSADRSLESRPIWEPTAIAVVNAIYTSAKTFYEAIDQSNMRHIASDLHSAMINNQLWKAGESGGSPLDLRPVAFSELTPEMRANYSLLVVAALAGLSEYADSQELSSRAEIQTLRGTKQAVTFLLNNLVKMSQLPDQFHFAREFEKERLFRPHSHKFFPQSPEAQIAEELYSQVRASDIFHLQIGNSVFIGEEFRSPYQEALRLVSGDANRPEILDGMIDRMPANCVTFMRESGVNGSRVFYYTASPQGEAAYDLAARTAHGAYLHGVRRIQTAAIRHWRELNPVLEKIDIANHLIADAPLGSWAMELSCAAQISEQINFAIRQNPEGARKWLSAFMLSDS